MLDWLPEQVSSFGGDLDALLWLIYVLTGIWFILLHVYLVYVLLRFRRKPGVRAQYLTGESRRQMAWIVVPTFIILLLDFWVDAAGHKVWAAVKNEQPPADLEVQVTGKQFNWEMLYPGPDGKFGTKDDKMMENSLHIPINKVVRVQLGSKDVLHSFFLPHLRFKQDAVPGRRIPIWFQATKAGKYAIGCAELCGFGHTTMGGILTVHEDAAWQEWVAKKWPAPAAPAAAPAPAPADSPAPGSPSPDPSPAPSPTSGGSSHE